MVGQKKSEGKKPARKWSCTMRGPVSRLPGKARRPALCLAATRITEGCAQKSVSQRVVCAGEETSRYATESEQPMQHIETQCKWCCGLITHTHTHTHGTTPEKKPVCGVSLGPGASVHGAAQQQTVPRNGAVQQARHSQAAFLGRGEKKGRPPPVVALFGNPRRHVTKPALHVPLPVWGRGQEKETRMQKL